VQFFFVGVEHSTAVAGATRELRTSDRSEAAIIEFFFISRR
jgi:hypothetical protein